MATKKSSKQSQAAKLHQRAEDHNYDDAPSRLRSIIRSKNCDLGTALLVYWRGDPNYYRLFPSRWAMKDDAAADVALFDVLVEVEQRVMDGKYGKFEIHFDPFRDIGRMNWAKNHYEFDWDDFYCDLPVEMYGKSTLKQLKSVRPVSDRPVGLSIIAEAEDDTFDAKTQAAIDELEKHNREGSNAGVVIVDEDDSWTSNTPEIHVNFRHQKVPDRIFEHLKSIPGVVSLAFGDKSTDSVLKYLVYTPDLLELDIRGTFTLRGMSNLKHVGQLKRLTIFNDEKKPNGRWLSSFSHVPNLLQLRVVGGEFAKFHLDSFSELTKLEELTLLCQIPPETDFRPLLKSNIRELSIGGTKTDVHIPAILQLAKLRKLQYLQLYDTRFSDAGLKELRKAFRKELHKAFKKKLA